MPLTRKKLRILVWSLVVLVLVWLAGEWGPRLLLRTPGMDLYQSSHFVVWAEAADRRAAIELRTALEDRGGQALALLGQGDFPAGVTEFFLYPDRLSFTLHSRGLWAAWFDHAGTVSAQSRAYHLLVSPENPGLGHDRQSVLYEAVASWIRQQLVRMIPQTALWVREGLVAYLAGASREDEAPGELPGPETMESDQLAVFLAAGGDRTADAFMAWVIWRYGREKPVELAVAGQEWLSAMGLSLPEAHGEWLSWMRAGRPRDPRLARDRPPGDEEY